MIEDIKKMENNLEMLNGDYKIFCKRNKRLKLEKYRNRLKKNKKDAKNKKTKSFLKYKKRDNLNKIILKNENLKIEVLSLKNQENESKNKCTKIIEEIFSNQKKNLKNNNGHFSKFEEINNLLMDVNNINKSKILFEKNKPPLFSISEIEELC